MQPSKACGSQVPPLFLHVKFQLRCGFLLATDVCEDSVNGRSGEERQIPPALSGAQAYFHSYCILCGKSSWYRGHCRATRSRLDSKQKSKAGIFGNVQLCQGYNFTCSCNIQHPSPLWGQVQQGVYSPETVSGRWVNDGTASVMERLNSQGAQEMGSKCICLADGMTGEKRVQMQANKRGRI